MARANPRAKLGEDGSRDGMSHPRALESQKMIGCERATSRTNVAQLCHSRQKICSMVRLVGACQYVHGKQSRGSSCATDPNQSARQLLHAEIALRGGYVCAVGVVAHLLWNEPAVERGWGLWGRLSGWSGTWCAHVQADATAATT